MANEAQWKSLKVKDHEFQFTSLKKRTNTDLEEARGGQSSQSLEAHSWLDEEKGFTENTATLDWPNLPRILLTNARSINNKKQDLLELINTDEDVQKCDIILITETWLKEGSPNIHDSDFIIMRRADRDEEKTGKIRGGGLCALMKDMRVEQKETVSDPNYELMPFLCYRDGQPEDTPPLIFILAYIPGPDFRKAKSKITEYYKKVQQWSRGGPILLLGDFNRSEFSDLEKNAPTVEQYVTCPTRGGKTLDKCYGNIKPPYKSKCKPPLRSKDNNSDHNIIILTQEECNTCDHTETEAFWERRDEEKKKKEEEEKKKKEEERLSQGLNDLHLSGDDKKKTQHGRPKAKEKK